MAEQSLEEKGYKEPDLNGIVKELEQAQVDATQYIDRLERCRHWWHCIWKDQSYDGRKHAIKEADVVLPWEGASDSRLRIVDTIIDQHVTIAKAAFWGAKINVKSYRPFVYGRVANVAQKLLTWHVYTQMRRELLRELWFFWGWKYGFGLSFMGIEWEQQRDKSYEPITVEELVQISQQLDMPEILDIETDETSDNAIAFLQSLSPILDKTEARKIISELRNDGVSKLPVIDLTVNRPKWTALMPCADILIPSETREVQTGRFVNRRELVNETDLVDRIETDHYDPDFVEEALKHKGEFGDWLTQPGWRYNSQGSERDQVELQHFYMRYVDEDKRPCIYRTIFNQAVIGKHPGLAAVHRPFEYNHKFYPIVAGRRTYDFPAMLSSMGISEEAYTDEMDIKAQQDGLNDRTDLINSPPMVVPTLRAQGVRSQYGPRAIMTALRPNDVQWAPLPPKDNTPESVIQMVYLRLNERYAIYGNEVDPQFKQARVQELAQDVHTEIELMAEQTLKLAQQFDDEETINKVAGKPDQPVKLSNADLLGDHEISVTMDMKNTDIEYVKEKMGLFQIALQMNQAGTARMNKIFSRVMALIDPDADDLVEEDQQDATQREVSEEKNAAAQILSGIEPDKPQFGNHQLRLQTLLENTMQSKNPEVMQAIAQSKAKQMMLKNRIAFFQNQIQQYTKNPQIGRTLTHKTFEPKEPAGMTGE